MPSERKWPRRTANIKGTPSWPRRLNMAIKTLSLLPQPGQNFAEIEKGISLFEAAMKEAFGPTGSMQAGKDLNNCLISSHSELRRRRPDLSINMPSDMAEMLKTVGEARWVRTIAVHVRPGRVDEFEAQVK